MPAKQAWNVAFERYMRTLDSAKPVIWGGDVNCAPTSRGKLRMALSPLIDAHGIFVLFQTDIRNDKSNWNKTAGYTAIECEGFERILNPSPPDSETHEKLIDLWREMHPEEVQYSYFSYRFDARTKGMGWRIDMCTF